MSLGGRTYRSSVATVSELTASLAAPRRSHGSRGVFLRRGPAWDSKAARTGDSGPRAADAAPAQVLFDLGVVRVRRLADRLLQHLCDPLFPPRRGRDVLVLSALVPFVRDLDDDGPGRPARVLPGVDQLCDREGLCVEGLVQGRGGDAEVAPARDRKGEPARAADGPARVQRHRPRESPSSRTLAQLGPDELTNLLPINLEPRRIRPPARPALYQLVLLCRARRRRSRDPRLARRRGAAAGRRARGGRRVVPGARLAGSGRQGAGGVCAVGRSER